MKKYLKKYGDDLDMLHYLILTDIGYYFEGFDEFSTPKHNELDDDIHVKSLGGIDELKVADKKVTMTYEDSETETEKPKVVLPQSAKKKCEEDFLEYLIFAYTGGIDAVNEMLETGIEPNEDRMYESINKSVAGKTYRERLSENLNNSNYEGVTRLADTEFHRIFNEAIADGGKEAGAKTKTWATMLDDKVRDTHEFLEGVTVPFEDKFHTYDGDSAFEPGGFADASNNINCRCYLELK